MVKFTVPFPLIWNCCTLCVYGASWVSY